LRCCSFAKVPTTEFLNFYQNIFVEYTKTSVDLTKDKTK
jgi:hypothetical protein